MSDHEQHLATIRRERELEKEVERLKDALAEALAAMSSDGADAVMDNQLLRAEVKRLKEALGILANGALARIDAALKIAEGASLQTTSASVIGEIIAALEGE